MSFAKVKDDARKFAPARAPEVLSIIALYTHSVILVIQAI